MTIQCVLFDLGGVLVELGGVRDFGEMIGEPDENLVWSRWLTSPCVRAYERGHCSTDQFARELIDEFALECSADEFAERFRVWPRGLISGAYELVEQLSARLTVACLSNTNPLHWERQRDAMKLGSLFPTRFLSHELGMIKPDREIFDHVVDALQLAPESILFFDDNQINIEAAREAGLCAERVVGPDPVRAKLRELDLIGA